MKAVNETIGNVYLYSNPKVFFSEWILTGAYDITTIKINKDLFHCPFDSNLMTVSIIHSDHFPPQGTAHMPGTKS
jgi:hypothetical protein